MNFDKLATGIWVIVAGAGFTIVQWVGLSSTFGQLQPRTELPHVNQIPPPPVSSNRSIDSSLMQQFESLTAEEQLPYTWQAQIRQIAPSPENAMPEQTLLVVTAQMQPGYYLYSLTQTEGLATTLEVALNDQFKIKGPFRPSTAPTVIESDPDLQIPVEKHTGRIEFQLPIELTNPAQLADISIDVRINGQICGGDGTCRIIRNLIQTARWNSNPAEQTARPVTQNPPSETRR